MEKKNRAYLLPHTHWDREWRYPLWKTRSLLIKFMDELLDILKTDPEYRCFLMDGQVAPVLDYLEIKPERRAEVEAHVATGRIAVGPWYTLPDLYPVDGECLVRNLLWGTRAAGQLGGCLRVGYNSFGWGQTAQFPQLYAGFGIDFIVCAKKVSEERAPESEFWWQGPDGTRALTTRLGEFARANFYFNASLPAKYGVNCISSEFRYRPALSGAAMHNAAPEKQDEDFFMARPKTGWDAEKLAAGYADALKATDATAFPQDRLFLNGTDFSTPQPQLTEMRRTLAAAVPDTEFVHARLEEYAEALKAQADEAGLRTICGELRDGPAGDCSGNALASRIYLKMLNKRVQDVLIRQAEPLCAALAALGVAYPAGLLAKAWDYLLKSHPHDSINGVTQDKTANDVEYRLNQVLELAGVVLDDAAAALSERIDLSAHGEDAMLLLCYNPRPYTVKAVRQVCIATPKGQAVWGFTARDSTGNDVPVQVVSRDEKDYPVHDAEARPWPYAAHRHFCWLELELPPLGYEVVAIEPSQHFHPDHYYWVPMRRAAPGSILKAENVLENEHLRAEVCPNGGITLTHKASGRRWENLNHFEDAGDVGNYWAYYPPYHNQVHTTLTAAPRLWVEDAGPLSATLAVEYRWLLPARGHESRKGVQGKGARSEELETLRILSRITLQKGSEKLDIRTTVWNNLENHRLRVGFPTGIAAECADAAGHFTVDSRPRVNQPAADGSYWPEMQTLPMQSFVDISDGQMGLALLSNCLTEYEYAGDEAGTAYMTLLRAMGNMIVTWWEAVGEAAGQKGSQLQREMTFDYAVYPHAGDWQSGTVYKQAEALQSPPQTYQIFGDAKGSLPQRHSFVAVENPQVRLSTLKKAEDSGNLILRLYNPTGKAQQTEVRFGFPVKAAWLCNLDEERADRLDCLANSLQIDLAKGKIVTVELVTE